MISLTNRRIFRKEVQAVEREEFNETLSIVIDELEALKNAILNQQEQINELRNIVMEKGR